MQKGNRAMENGKIVSENGQCKIKIKQNGQCIIIILNEP